MVVLDTSVIAKWFHPEPGSDRALRFKEAHLNGDELIVCPDIVVYELANLLATKPIKTDDEIREILELFFEMEIHLIPIGLNLALYSAGIARQHREFKMSVYDAAYIAQADALKCDFVTADEKLVKAVNVPFVKLL